MTHPQKHREDVHSVESKRKGLDGLIERALRRFRAGFQAVVMVPLYLLAGILYGAALVPSVLFHRFLARLAQPYSEVFQTLAACLGIGVGFFLFGFSLICLVPVLNLVLGRGVKPWRGPYYSLPAIRWFLHNGLTYLVRYIFLEFVTPSPFLNLFYSWMGMKIGRGVQINSTHISDPSLIEVGDRATIGGSATIVGHYGVGGYLVIAPVKIGAGATVGLKATVMGGVEIGEGARILPNSVVLPKTKIPAGQTWGGVPAKHVEAVKSPEPEHV